jgi:HlyD family secretion protein
MDVVVDAKGIIRPAQERTVVKSASAGLLDTIWVKEGQFIRKGGRMAVLKDERSMQILAAMKAEMNRKKELLNDLFMLTTIPLQNKTASLKLKSDLYNEQFSRFIQQQGERGLALSLTEKEFTIAEKLVNDRIISPAEFENKKSAYQQKSAGLHGFFHDQLSVWNKDKQILTDDIDQLEQEISRLLALYDRLHIIAPVSGFVMGIQDQYTGGFLQPGDVLCSISPEDSLIAECFVSPENIGFLKLQQPVSFRIDAFDPRQFGIVQGHVQAIDNDFSTINASPVFKIRCSLEQSTVSLKNGYAASLKKGMTMQARFKITQRTIWQLFFDKLHNWFNPVVTV